MKLILLDLIIMKTVFEKTPFDDINLVPRDTSYVASRSIVDTSKWFGNAKLSVPIIASPMIDVVGKSSLPEITSQGFAYIHRFQSLAECVEQISSVKNQLHIGAAISLKNYQDQIDFFATYGVMNLCIDTANGCNYRVEQVISYIKKVNPSIFITAGNVASKEGCRILTDWGVNAIRVGLSGGAGCKTRNETGIYRHPIRTIREVVDWKNKQNKPIYLLWDGGIKKGADFVKCMALGLDGVIMGRELAAASNSPAKTICIDGKVFKAYRGSASHEVHKGNSNYIEGFQAYIEVGDTVEKILNRYKRGLQSAMSYFGCLNLRDFAERVTESNIEQNSL